MKPKMKIKMAIDLVMTILLLVLMAYVVTGGLIHEIAGTAMLVLFIVHNILNYKWYKGLLRGRYNSLRIAQTVLNLLLLICMVLLMISGIMMSSYVFKFLNISVGMSLARKMHMLASYWSFIFMSLHLGLHFSMITSMMKKGRTNPSKKVKIIEMIVSCVVVVYGAYAFYKHKIFTYLVAGNVFAFFKVDESAVMFFVDYLAIMGMIVFVADCFKKVLNRKK